MMKVWIPVMVLLAQTMAATAMAGTESFSVKGDPKEKLVLPAATSCENYPNGGLDTVLFKDVNARKGFYVACSYAFGVRTLRYWEADDSQKEVLKGEFIFSNEEVCEKVRRSCQAYNFRDAAVTVTVDLVESSVLSIQYKLSDGKKVKIQK